ncbi:MAG: hypothetical protein JRE27_08605, partial [Deltaproteobacteria bacterium]|nr:hypothetical protein [Deltaproteobacteria bacterium]
MCDLFPFNHHFKLVKAGKYDLLFGLADSVYPFIPVVAACMHKMLGGFRPASEMKMNVAAKAAGKLETFGCF